MVQGLIIVLKQIIKLKPNLPKEKVENNCKLGSNDTFIYFPLNPILGVFCGKTFDIQPPHLNFNHLINEKYIGG